MPNQNPSPPEETFNITPSKAQKELLLSLLLKKLRCMHQVERKLNNNNNNNNSKCSSSSKTSVMSFTV
jgi:hypothetical protein